MPLKRNFLFKFKYVVIVLGLFLGACATKSTNTSPPIQFGGWVTYWDFNRGMKTAIQGKGVYRDIFLFSTQLDANGTPFVVNSKTIDYPSAVAQLKTSGTRTWMTLVNDVKIAGTDKSILKDPIIVHKILHDKAARLQHRRAIMDLALKYGVSGIDIDYENLLPEDRGYFSRFIAELSRDLKQRDLALSVTVQPKTLKRSASGNSAMDWSAICKHADRLQIMLYDQHGKKTPPGPLATVDWISEVLQYAKSQCKATTIVPIVKVSGMHWASDETTAIHYDQAVALKTRHKALLEREATSQVPFFTYKTIEVSGMVYFEDALSLKIKIHRILGMGFGKLVFWSLGRQDPQLVAELNKILY